MKTSTEPMAYGFLAGAFFFLTALVIMQTGCAGMSVRSPTQQHNAAVKIITSCTSQMTLLLTMPDGSVIDTGLPTGRAVVRRFGGTGVLVSAYHVVTAKHVVTCAENEELSVAINTGPGADRQAFVEFEFPNYDIARLIVKDSLAYFFTPITIGPLPTLGQQVCEASKVPRDTWRCGTTQKPDDEGLIVFEMITEHGNSGSGLYNAAGQLVGIVVQWWPTEGGEHHGGKASPVQTWPFLVP